MSPEFSNTERRAESRDLKERIQALETAVEHLSGQIESLVHILAAAQGFFAVLEFLGRIMKPLLFLGGIAAAIAAAVNKAKTGT